MAVFGTCTVVFGTRTVALDKQEVVQIASCSALLRETAEFQFWRCHKAEQTTFCWFHRGTTFLSLAL